MRTTSQWALISRQHSSYRVKILPVFVRQIQSKIHSWSGHLIPKYNKRFWISVCNSKQSISDSNHDLWYIPFAAATESGDLETISLATFIASVMGSSHVRVTYPRFSTWAPFMIFPLKVNSLATSIRTNSRVVIVAPMSGINPHFAYMTFEVLWFERQVRITVLAWETSQNNARETCMFAKKCT